MIMWCLQERRRHDIEVKVQQTQEIEKAAAVQERKDLFEHCKQQKNKIIRLAGQMELVAMVRADIILWRSWECSRCSVVSRDCHVTDMTVNGVQPPLYGPSSSVK